MGARLDAAVAALRSGALVVYPTDTLLGLGADATNPSAVERLGAVKRRGPALPISVAVSSLPEIDRWAALNDAGRSYARRTLPGPFTLLVPASAEARRRLAPGIVGPDGAVGIRVPDHPVARELARRLGPLTATSANVHGAPPARSIAEARAALGRSVAVYLDDAPTPTGRPSTLADLRGAVPSLVRRS